ncbi:MAG: hypothetical protein J6C42_14200 [Clostridia bacterium]|nr:hypothetical protein [Oscillospiraceae bacterium]MBO5258646.1 hypothetical protein [Clostridia bacterium]
MIRKAEYVCVFLAGGVIYSLIELLWRGFTHWSMTLAGGVCVLLIHCFNQRMRKRSMALRCGVGCAVITAVEFAAGVLVNLVLGWNVWDYSAMYGNVLGQICPAFSCMWFLISFPACGFSSLARWFFDGIETNENRVQTA